MTNSRNFAAGPDETPSSSQVDSSFLVPKQGHTLIVRTKEKVSATKIR